MTTPELSAPARFLRARRGVLATALWLFGLSTTVLLASMWGRAVASDDGVIEAGAKAAFESDVVSDRITGWIADGIASTAGDLPEGTALSAATAVWEHPETADILSAAVDELVAAALAPPGNSVPVDLATALRPLSPIVITELGARGVALPRSTIDAALAAVPTVVLSSATESGVSAAVAAAKSTLTKVGAVGLVGMLLSGLAAVVAAEDRLRQVRALAIRVAVSALTFTVLLRLGAWALDPRGGRSPLAAGGSVLLSSNLHVLAGAVLVAGGVAAVTTAVARRRRRLVTV